MKISERYLVHAVLCGDILDVIVLRELVEIAELVGFCNSNYFHKIFKQYINSSPLVYRKAKGN